MSDHGPLQSSPAQPAMQVALSLGQSLTTYATVDDVLRQMLTALVELTSVDIGAVYVNTHTTDYHERGVMYASGEMRLLEQTSHDPVVQRVRATATFQQVELPEGVQASFPLVQEQTVVGVAQLLFPDAETCSFYRRSVGVLLRFGSVAVVNANKLEQLHMRVAALERVQSAEGKPLEKVRLLAMSELAAAVAHQLNNPLTTILVDTEMMLSDRSPDDAMYNSLLAIYRAGRRAADVAHRLMSVSYSESIGGTPQVVNVADSIWETISVLQSSLDSENIDVETHFSPGVPSLFVEPGMLSDVWFNLVMNAKDELVRHGGGKIGLEVYLTGDDDRIEIVVWDTGDGVDVVDYERIFEPFFTQKSKAERTGLGLYICRQIVRDLGGELIVGRHDDGGAQFTVRLPVKKG